MKRSTLFIAIAVCLAVEAVAVFAVDWKYVQVVWLYGLARATGVSWNTLVVLAGTGLLGAAAGAIGVFAVLRRRALLGDAASHAALPGICLAFLVIGSRDFIGLSVGALVTGILGVIVINFVVRHTRIKSDAAIGIVLSVFFGAGIVLVRSIQNDPELGARAAGLNSYLLGKTAGMIARDLLVIVLVAVNVLALLLALYKEFRLVGFDPDFAAARGWPVLAIDFVLAGAIVITVVTGLAAVGVVLMAALLILPAVAARFWTDRLDRLLGLSAIFGFCTGIACTWASVEFH